MLRKSFIHLAAYLLLILVLSVIQMGTLTVNHAAGQGPTRLLPEVGLSALLPDKDHPVAAATPMSHLMADTYWAIETIDPDSGAGWFSSLAIDDNGYLHVSYSFNAGPDWDLRYAISDGTGWITELVDDSGRVGQHNSLALDQDGHPHISYRDVTELTNTALKHARWDGDSWITMTPDSGGYTGGFTSVAYSPSNNNVHISYSDETNESLKYARWTGSAWEITTVDNGPGVGAHTSLALRGNSPRISYLDYANNSLKLAAYVAATNSWNISNLNSGGGGEFTSMVMDTSGFEHISYSKGGHGVRYIYRNASGWHDELVVADTSEVIPTALALDSNNQPHIAFVSDVEGEPTLRYATFDGSVWQIATVDDSVWVTSDSVAIVVDASGTPHITYGDWLHGLRHAWLSLTPDLIVTDIWEMDGEVWCQVRNIGQGAAPAGHEVALHVDDVYSGASVVPIILAPGERYNTPIASWSCSGITNTLRVTADYGEIIVEADKTNNEREEIWTCDTIPPQITWGPAATSITPNSAVIAWNTDKNSDSRVYYDESADGYSGEVYAAGAVTAHQITLTGLTPATVYRYAVASSDLSGNTVVSGDNFFETPALPAEPVTGTLQITRRDGDYPIYDLTAVVNPTDQAFLSHVGGWEGVYASFFLDDELIGHSYRPIERSDGFVEFKYTLHPRSLDPPLSLLTREKFFQRGTSSVKLLVTTDGSMTLAHWEALWDPPWQDRPISLLFYSPQASGTAMPLYYADPDIGALLPGTQIRLGVEAFESEWECGDSSTTHNNWSDPVVYHPPVCNDVARQVGEVQFYVNNELVHSLSVPTTPGTFDYVYDYDAGGMPAGNHTLKARALASDDPTNYREVVKPIRVVGGDPLVDIQRSVTRNGNYFDVTLTISLSPLSNAPVWLKHIEDFTIEFMAADRETETYSVSVERYPTWGNDGARMSRVLIDFATGGIDMISLHPGQQLAVTYQAVPILYEDGMSSPSLGLPQTRLHYWKLSQDLQIIFNRPWQGALEVTNARKAADYIIVTNPSRLKALYNEADVYQLYSAMARLAVARNGVLGFLDTYEDQRVLDNLLEPGGYWSESLHPAFQQSGNHAYVLIVGETEIVPAYNSYNYDICWAIPGSTFHCSRANRDIPNHDQWYSSIAAPGNPELNLGRIIGNTAAELRIPIETSIAVSQGLPGYNYQVLGRALVVAESDADGFWNSAQNIRSRLQSSGWSFPVNLKLPDENPDAMLHATVAQGWSLIHLLGHGNVDRWGRASLHTSVPLNMGGYAPFVFNPACLTGHYEGNNDISLAEKMLQWGAAVYIGATQVTPLQLSLNYSDWFYNHDWNPENGEAIGRAFAQLERDKYHAPGLFGWYDWARFWVVEHNLYGDPKFGDSAPTVAASARSWPMGDPTTSLQVQVPAYVVTATHDGFDAVEIPGGKILSEGGLPQVPYWIVTVDYAPGYRVQDVTLAARNGRVFTTGLTLPVTEMIPSSGVALPAGETEPLPGIEDDDWLPARDRIYHWRVNQHPDGSSELYIEIAPFHYQPATTNIEWHDHFTFEIEVVSVAVEIQHFQIDKGQYNLGENVIAEMVLHNPDAAQKLIVAPTIRNMVSEEVVVDGLQLHAFHEMVGTSYYTFAWDSAGFAPGEYLLYVELRDEAGNLLQSASRMFQLGVASAEIAAFSATPTIFQPGDPVATSLTIHNTGPTVINGEAIIEVQTSNGITITQTFTHTVTGLLPGAAVTLNNVWDTVGATEEAYRIVAYLKYDARTTEIATIRVATQAYIYLPLIVRPNH